MVANGEGQLNMATRVQSKPRANRYPGPCRLCGVEVPAGGGVLRLEHGDHGRWLVEHRPAVWAGSPVSGRWVDGCPDERGE